MIERNLKRLFLAILALFGLIVLMFVLRIDIGIDLEKVLYASIIPLVLVGLWYLIKHFLKPDRTVRLVTSVVLESPPRILSTLKNHKLHIKCERHIEEKGKVSIIKSDEVIMSFNKKDHPDLQRYSHEIVRDFLENQKSTLRDQYPDSRLLIAPFSLITKEKTALDQ